MIKIIYYKMNKYKIKKSERSKYKIVNKNEILLFKYLLNKIFQFLILNISKTYKLHIIIKFNLLESKYFYILK